MCLCARKGPPRGRASGGPETHLPVGGPASQSTNLSQTEFATPKGEPVSRDRARPRRVPPGCENRPLTYRLPNLAPSALSSPSSRGCWRSRHGRHATGAPMKPQAWKRQAPPTDRRGQAQAGEGQAATRRACGCGRSRRAEWAVPRGRSNAPAGHLATRSVPRRWGYKVGASARRPERGGSATRNLLFPRWRVCRRGPRLAIGAGN